MFSFYPQVVNFLLQQTRGLLSEETKLVDSRNHMGATPLMKCIYTGMVIAMGFIVGYVYEYGYGCGY